MSRNVLKLKLDALVRNNVETYSILNCASSFLCSVERIDKTVQDLRSGGIENISSWMLTRSNVDR